MGSKFWLRFTTGETQDGGGSDPGSDQGFTPITSQDDLNRVIQERVTRERKKFADYNDLKTKAAELDQIKAANQTEAEKAAAQITALQQQLEAMQLTTLKARIQAKHGISDDDAALFLTASDEETLTKQAEALAERDANRKKQGPVVTSQGNHPTNTTDDDARSFARQLFNRT